MALPPGMKNGLIVNPLPSGELEVKLVSDGEECGCFNCKPDRAAMVAAQFLAAAKVAHERTGKPLPSRTEEEGNWANVQPSTLGLGPCPLPEHESLVVRFGEAALGIALPRTILRQMGEAMITMSADGDKPH